MKTETMTLHKALAELKILDDRINKAIVNFEPIGLQQFGKPVGDSKAKMFQPEDFNKNAVADYQSIRDLIERKTAIKTALVKKNSETMLTVGSKTMSIADAITQKDYLISRVNLLDKLDQTYNLVHGMINKNNEKIEKDLKDIIISALGKDTTKHDENIIENMTKAYKQQNEFVIVDPLKLGDVIKAMRDDIDIFSSEVDGRLSEINAVTFISIGE